MKKVMTMWSGKKFALTLTVLALAAAAVFAGGKKEAATAKPQITVGTSGAPAPYGWINEDGSLDGYDNAVIQAIAAILPDYSFKIDVTEFPSIFAGLDSGRYHIGMNNLSWRADRAEKYLYSNEYYLNNKRGIVVQKGRTDIRGIPDLGGKSAYVSADGSYPQLFLEDYNTSHPGNPVKITYSDEDALKTYQRIVNGTLDFIISESVQVDTREKEFGIDVDFIPFGASGEADDVQNPKAYFLFPRTSEGERTRALIDNALVTLKNNGELGRISTKFFGQDLSR